MRHLPSIATTLLLQGCTSLSVGIDRTASAGGFNPLTQPTVNVEKYNADKQLCFKQVQPQTDTNNEQNNTIIKFRECLIQKGYVLLS
jgi:hypothetical protein